MLVSGLREWPATRGAGEMASLARDTRTTERLAQLHRRFQGRRVTRPTNDPAGVCPVSEWTRRWYTVSTTQAVNRVFNWIRSSSSWPEAVSTSNSFRTWQQAFDPAYDGWLSRP